MSCVLKLESLIRSNAFPTMPGEGVIPPNALRQMKQPILMLHGVEDRFVAKERSIN